MKTAVFLPVLVLTIFHFNCVLSEFSLRHAALKLVKHLLPFFFFFPSWQACNWAASKRRLHNFSTLGEIRKCPLDFLCHVKICWSVTFLHDAVLSYRMVVQNETQLDFCFAKTWSCISVKVFFLSRRITWRQSVGQMQQLCFWQHS